MPDQIYLYGVDYMSTFDIKTYFERFASDKEALVVGWINDSSCTVKFESADLAKKAYTDSSLSTLSGEKHSVQVGQAVVDGTKGEVDPRNFDPTLGWKEALGF
jgi:Nuclear cap-binding protein subunit 3